ncbi:DUF445 domain-containing protein [Rummeliibacillus sp. TYF-LIM-RU47]|uniref:DUF445 domain-containing protein n=1 Tax=Rummeliibacillus sp. TYF-LIM-RU47 TaxID=2608406 RepID=UPI001CC25AAB|nr:DUF445 family protein [Rummeliibacillus sp. TYF-LIM-RU47]
MNTILTIVFMTVIGAVIGGFTNHIAIKMLFRPHNPIYIGSWRVPFTPGLIPKRREDLARQLGKTVVNYLLTPEMFRKKLFTVKNRELVEGWLNDKIRKLLFTDEKTLNDWLTQIGAAHMPDIIEQKVDQAVAEQLDKIKNVLSNESIESLLPESWEAKANKKIPEMSRYILEKAGGYFESPEGTQTIKRLIDDFLESKGTVGGMIQMFLGDSKSLVGRVQKEINKFIQAPGTMVLLTNLLSNEWQKVKVQSVTNLLGDLDFTSTTNRIQSYAKKELALQSRLDKPLVHYWQDGPEWFAGNIVPQMTEKGFALAESQLEDAIKRLNLEQIVKEQVDSFPVSVLEDLVLGISKKEFKMITVLGFVLGGLIGIIQGIVVIIF